MSNNIALTQTTQNSAADPASLRSVILVGACAALLFFGLFGAWTSLAHLESAAVAHGMVVVDTRRKKIQHLEGGIVTEIPVSEGERVEAGQVLVRLDDTQPKAVREQLYSRLIGSEALVARLRAERDGRGEIFFPISLTEKRDDARVREVLDGQIQIFETRRQSLSTEASVLNQRIGQLKEEIQGYEGEIAADDRQLELIGEEIQDIQSLFDRKLIDKPRLLALQRREAEIAGNRSRYQGAIARNGQAIGETEILIGQLNTEQLKETVAVLRDAESELFDLKERMTRAADILERTRILAPQDGVIVGLSVHAAGAVIASGETLMEIVPDRDRLVVEARVRPDDIDVVRPGLDAEVRITAFNQRDSVPLRGKVVLVSPDLMQSEVGTEAYFLARVETEETEIEAAIGGELHPGMQAEVMMLTGTRTPIEYLLEPVTRSLNRAMREGG